LGVLLKAAFGPGGMTLEAFGNTRLTLINSLVMLFINVGLGVTLIPEYGIVGAAIATGVTLTVGGLIAFLEIYFLYQMVPFSLETIKSIGIGVFTGILFYGISFWLNPKGNILLIGLVLVMTTIYGVGSYLTGSLDKVDREVIRGIFSRFSIK
jgi:O-antigen/teichoic acid export membrane protein